ncbi:MAG: hypothetical protein EOP45_10470 [Sphingobacteriaceae bacterium]|nr:MAG: hypothetical protein EOP45_10470 [Sphingobacteriaceae bacterium]
MQNSFEIDYQGKKVPVAYQKDEKENQYLFTLELPDGPLKLQCTKDNEGAFKWLQEDDSASEKATDIGTTIETYLMKNSIEL